MEIHLRGGRAGPSLAIGGDARLCVPPVLLTLFLILTACTSSEGPQDPIVVPPCRPTIYSVDYAAPAPGAYLQRESIVYLAGNAIDVRLTVPTCLAVADVTAEGAAPDDVSGTGGGIPWRVVSDVALSIERHRLTVRFPSYLTSGRSRRITINLALGPIAAAHTFTLVEVAEVRAPRRDYSISEAEIFDALVANVYRNTVAANNNSETSWDVRPEFDTFVLDSASDGIRFRMEFEKSIPNFCDIEVTATGRMKLNPTATGVGVSWEAGPDASVSMPFWCEIPASVLGPGYLIAKALAIDSVEDTIRQNIQTLVTGLLPGGGCAPVPCTLVIREIETRDDDVVVRFNQALFPTGVAFEVPYRSLHPTSTWVAGLGLNGGEEAFIMASGTVDVCCLWDRIGPAGLFNWNTNAPVPDPWQFTGSQWVHYKERANARAVLRGMKRDRTTLPLPDQNVGELIVRSSFNDEVLRANEPCAITTPAGDPVRILFSNNDELLQSRGVRRFYVSVLWPSDVVPEETLKACTA
jgi:hypothetical protein